ncbi:hypothetical protein [Solitalea lacus]|uniref:hypothetical protein n=1 Tax=Solitalea lacus TaxID=2911172 RepID=UPI001EDB181D|nr:hypothetical protein [Solitalea lacus]UKJ09049.1 hypothetical protein L2B55_07740 [Solitalea lacus]
MNNISQSKNLFTVSWIISILIIVASCVGLFVPGTYAKEAPNWLVQSIGQDIINLFLISPLLIAVSILAFKGIKTAMILWSGLMIYLNYTYVIYCFDIHFNKLFLIYCLILGLSFYSLIYFLVSQIKHPTIKKVNDPMIVRITGIYLIVLACLFYFLWLLVVIPANVNNTVPKDLLETKLVTNPIHVLDLSICLPGFFIVGLMVMKKNSLGLIMAPSLMVFCILMDITIGSLGVIMKLNGFMQSFFTTFIMGVLMLFTTVLLFLYLKNSEGLIESK